jgi:hypothetical protein
MIKEYYNNEPVRMIIVIYLLDLFLGTENVDSMFLRNVCQPQTIRCHIKQYSIL